MNSPAIIVAVAENNVIGLAGKLPWHYPADLRWFKEATTGATVIMGRITWESIGSRPLRGRRNIVVSSRSVQGVEVCRDLASALKIADGMVWFIGGAMLYREALLHAESVDMTYVPERIVDPRAVRFPDLDPSDWLGSPKEPHPIDAQLSRRVFRRLTPLEKKLKLGSFARERGGTNNPGALTT